MKTGFLPESLNGGCRSSKETFTEIRRAASETPIPAADDIALVLRRRMNDPWN
jgi:hypothetical protein